MDWWKTVHVNRLTLSLDHNALWISFCYSHWYAMAQSICRTLVIILKNLRLDSLEVYMTYVFKTLLKFTRQLANRHCFTCNLKLFNFFLDWSSYFSWCCIEFIGVWILFHYFLFTIASIGFRGLNFFLSIFTKITFR